MEILEAVDCPSDPDIMPAEVAAVFAMLLALLAEEDILPMDKVKEIFEVFLENDGEEEKKEQAKILDLTQ